MQKGQGELDALNAVRDGTYSEAPKVHAGLILYVYRQGTLQTCEGLIRKGEEAAAIAAGILETSDHGTDESPKSPISQKLREDLARVPQGARQHAALRDPDLLIDRLAYQLSHDPRWSKPFV